jgi:hypothetical protein
MKQTAVEWLYKNLLENPISNQDIEYNEAVFHNAKEMEKQQSFTDVNRVEVIQHSPPYNGRAYTNYNAKDVELQLQDNNKTLKIFLK